MNVGLLSKPTVQRGVLQGLAVAIRIHLIQHFDVLEDKSDR